MSILNLHHVSQSFGGRDVFRGVSASIEVGSKIGLVGPNGVGKTSLLLILSGVEQPAGGTVSHSPALKIGYLRQEAVQAFANVDHTLIDEMHTVFRRVHELESQMRELEERMATEPTESVFDAYSTVQEAFEIAGGYDYETRIEETLTGLGFERDHYELPLRHLSGGQKTRALLARLLLENPDLLVLDEPTNHLDIEAVAWLETRLRVWAGTLLIVSHDRYFLDRVVNTIWELSPTGIETYKGNYSAYAHQRQERWERAEAVYTTERERLLAELDFVKRNIARASTNGVAVGRLRRLSRDLIAIREVGLLSYKNSSSWLQLGVGSIRPLTVQEAEDEIRNLQSPNMRPPRLNFAFRTDARSGDVVLRARDLVVGYPDKPLFIVDNITLHRGDRAAVIGGNGTGKTTLIKTLLGQHAPLEGRVMLGVGLKIGYFAQAHDSLNLENTVLDELLRHKNLPISEARNLLARYLFRSEDVYKRVGVLSGGERGRLALAILALDNANFLLMDEPTNHLDIAAQEMLQDVLEHYPGTVLMVTHDRYLVDRLATQVWSVEDGFLHTFAGTYSEFLERDPIHRDSARTAVRYG
jgi:ATP-binding cassette, subfamily F, member 3